MFSSSMFPDSRLSPSIGVLSLFPLSYRGEADFLSFFRTEICVLGTGLSFRSCLSESFSVSFERRNLLWRKNCQKSGKNSHS